MSIETLVLHCAVCSREVRLVRLNPETLTFGHVTNPRNNRHAVRLSRSADGRGSVAGVRPDREDNHRQSGAAATRLGQAANAVASSPDGRASGRSRVPSRSTAVTSSPERSRRDGTPLGSSPAPLSAGRS